MVWVVFKPFITWSKSKRLKILHGCNIQVSVHLSLKLRGQLICQRGDITSSTGPVFGLGHDMGRFPPFVLGSTQLLDHFLGSKKVVKKLKL